MGPIQSLEDLLSLLRRRAAVILLVSALGAIASIFYALQQPHVYQSTAVIQIEQPRITDALAASTVDESAARRLQLVEQRIMARGALIELIEERGIYDDLPGLTASEKIVLLRESTTIEGVAAAREGAADDGTISAVTIIVRMGSPEMARDVANDFAARILEATARERMDRTRTTLDFFSEEESRLAREIVALEEEIMAFRNANDLSIDGSIQFSRVEIASIREAILAIDREIIALQRELSELNENPGSSRNQRRIRDIGTTLVGLADERELLSGRATTLENDLRTTPDIDGRLATFDRQMERLQEQFVTASDRRIDAEVGHRLETSQQAERLQILENAVLPDYPVGPGRRKIVAMGTIASLMIALMAAFLLDVRNPVIRTSEQMRREIGLVPIVAITRLDSPWDKYQRQKPAILVFCLVALISILVAGSVTLSG